MAKFVCFFIKIGSLYPYKNYSHGYIGNNNNKKDTLTNYTVSFIPYFILR